MRFLVFCSLVSLVSGQCSTSASPFQLFGANDKLATCVLPHSNFAEVPFAEVSTVPNATVCALACDRGYNSETPLSRTLVCSGDTWEASIDTDLVCEVLTCPTLNAPIGSSSPACTGAVEETECAMECDVGFTPNQFTTRVCRHGQWSAGEFVCSPKLCPDLPTPADSTGSECYGKGEGEVCTWTCDVGATPAGSASRTCGNGVWSGTPFTCTPAQYCPQLYSPPGAYSSVCAHFTAGGVCSFQIMPGYSFTTRNPTRTCQANLTWSDDPIATTPLDCPALPAPMHAENTTSCGPSPQGTVCTHMCEQGYVSNNRGVWTCHNQEWRGSALVCAPLSCPVLTSPENAAVKSCEDAQEGAVCSFFCLPGFKATGHGTRVCRGGQWSGFSFQCTPDSTRYVWLASSYGPCVDRNTNKTCGPPGAGSLLREVACVDTSLSNYTLTPIANCQQQGGSHEVNNTLTCPLEACPTYSWQFGDWAPCSADCGRGYQERSAVCRGTNGVVGADSLCPPQSSLRRRSCNEQACVTLARYVASEWTPCSGMCQHSLQEINNTRTRYVQCLDMLGNYAPIAQCTTTPPPSVEECNTQPCAGYTWSACPWESCTAQCNGGGTKAGLMAGQRQRNVFCQDPQGHTVSSSLCVNFGIPPPITLLVGCNPLPCTAFNWMTTPWSACRGVGTVGTRTRSYHCHQADGSNAPLSDCPNPPPITVEPCTPNSCPTMAPTPLGTIPPTPSQLAPASRADISLLVVAASLIAFFC